MKKGFSIFVFVFSYFLCKSQGNIIILNKLNNEPIPYCLLNKFGSMDYFMSGEEGQIPISNFLEFSELDSIEISHIAFETKLILVKDILKDKIFLTPKEFHLSEVSVLNKKKKKIRLGNYKWFAQLNYPPYFSSLNCIKINNFGNEFKQITKLRYYIQRNGRPDAPFIPVLFGLDSEGEAEYEMIRTSIITMADCKDCWYEVDIRHLGIVMPYYGCMLCMKILPKSYYDKSLPPNSKNRKFFIRQVPNIGNFQLKDLQFESWQYDYLIRKTWVKLESVNLLMQIELE